MAVSGVRGRGGAEHIDEAADWAVSVVRRSLHGARDCKTPEPRNFPVFLTDLEAVGALFRNAQEAMLRLQSSGLLVAPPGTFAMTCHERRLLRATAAAQAENEVLVEDYILNLAPHPQARQLLTTAVTALATTLGSSGHWLVPLVLPAAALRVAQLHGLDLGTISVAWPHCTKRGHVPP
jgi:hypothetical protein